MSLTSDDPLGLGISGIGHGGYAEGFSVNGIDLRSFRSQLAAPSSQSTLQSLPLAQRKKIIGDIVELLEKHRGAHTFDQFHLLTAIDLHSDSHRQILEDLKRNNKILFDEKNRTVSYKPNFPEVKAVNDILAKVHVHPFGLNESLLADAYHGVQQDIDRLVEQQQIYRIRPAPPAQSNQSNDNSGSAPPQPPQRGRRQTYSILFPRRRAFEIPMDPAIVQLWRDVQVPANPAELDEQLIAHNLISGKQLKAAHSQKKSRMAQRIATKRKKSDAANLQRKRHRMNLTNTHLLNKDEYSWLKQTAKGQQTQNPS